MVDFYVKMIENGRLTLNQVPALWHEQVKKKLEERGVGMEGEIK